MSWNDGEYYEASFAIHKCRRYHAHLRDFYQGAHNWTAAVNAFAGSSAFVAILADAPKTAAGLSAAFALAAMLELIFKYEDRARRHHELCVQFSNVAAELETLEETPENLARVRAKRIKIEANENAVKRLVEIRSMVEEARARGVPEANLVHLSRTQCILGYVLTYGLKRLEKQKAIIEEKQRNDA